jgi:hypothetical protein
MNRLIAAQRHGYRLVGGMRQRRFDGTSFESKKLLENAHAAKRQSHHHGPGVLCRGSGARCVSPFLTLKILFFEVQ